MKDQEKFVKLYRASQMTGIGRRILETWIEQKKIPAIKHQSGKHTYTLLLMSEVEAALLKMRTESAA